MPCAIVTVTAGVTETVIVIVVSEVVIMKMKDETTGERSLKTHAERQTPVRVTTTDDIGDHKVGEAIEGVTETGEALSIVVRTHNPTGRRLFVLEVILIDRLQQPFSTLASTATGWALQILGISFYCAWLRLLIWPRLVVVG